MNSQPPKYFTRLLKWFCHSSLFEELQGDLEESFNKNTNTRGERKAKAIYRKEVLKMVRMSAIKIELKLPKFIHTSLLKFHFLLAFRNLKRNKVFSAVNIFGLAAALTICLFAVNMIYTGYQYDKDFKDVDRLYRITTSVESPHGKTKWATSSFALKWYLNSIPQIEASSIILTNMYEYFEVNGQDIYINGYPIDREFLDMFNFEVIEGNPYDLFNDLQSVVITDQLAQKVFGDESAIGKQTKSGAIVRAVIKSPKKQSHFNFEFLSNIEFLGSRISPEEFESVLKRWQNYDQSYYSYIKLNQNSNIDQLESQFEQISNKMTSAMADGNTYSMQLQPVSNIMFGKELIADHRHVYSRTALIILIAPIALLITLASFNYTNLSIARAIQRSKEIGIRKINGSTRGQIISQILVETVVFSLLALVLALCFYKYLVPFFEMYISEFSALFTSQLNVEIITWFVCFSLLVGFIAGFLPSLYFSKISPLASINESFNKKGIRISTLRKVFVGIQLTFSTFCILFVVLSLNQKDQILNTDLGFTSADLIAFPLKKVDPKLIEAELSKIPEIENFSFTSIIPGTGGMSRRFGFSENRMDTFSTRYATTDERFSQVYSPQLIIGSDFTEGLNNEILVDENFLASIGVSTLDALNTEVIIDHYDVEEKLRIVGILDNYICDGLEDNSLPLMIRNLKDTFLTKYATIKLQPANSEKVLSKLESIWLSIAGDKPLETEFVADKIERNYRPFFNMMNIFFITGLSIVIIALLGQFGMALYATQSRTKEIGIRKVLGASIGSIITLLSRGSFKTLFFSTLIALPLVFLVFREMIFPTIAIKLEISTPHLLLTVIGTWAIVLGIVAHQSWRTGLVNPTESLRNE
ncbi:ABC transporter permease [Roseivirga spongicola]|uniref:ABC3 transporter permease protein domain-containing protein n=1 Tax=Roseivirga spongicola TaxID=333140 RepID=A0A150X965_9BACT|nr:FtsX-like permease family protein [Roseivirga spongicola]KYG75243.1 hypothetical protein AWW68_10575 [Roseivirga spongicola]WPZ08600.1 permease prefix domain 2-containing transporter [Roseivirga spongicola]